MGLRNLKISRQKKKEITTDGVERQKKKKNKSLKLLKKMDSTFGREDKKNTSESGQSVGGGKSVAKKVGIAWAGTRNQLPMA